MKILRYIINSIKVLFNIITVFSLPHKSRKVSKWLKKNEKNQDPYLYPYKKRHEVLVKASKKTVKRMNIKIKVVGKENLLKGPMWIVANHSAQYDGMYVAAAIGDKIDLSVIAKKELQSNRYIKGLLEGVDAFFIDRKSPRDGVNILNRAANYAKQNNRSMLIFPEGTRMRDAVLGEFKSASFAFPQKYALPIVPMTIAGTLEARRWWVPGQKKLIITIHKPIKAIEHMKIPREILTKRVVETIQTSLTSYLSKMTPKEKERHEILKSKGIASGLKKSKKQINEN